jgi:hypothetical protein
VCLPRSCAEQFQIPLDINDSEAMKFDLDVFGAQLVADSLNVADGFAYDRTICPQLAREQQRSSGAVTVVL